MGSFIEGFKKGYNNQYGDDSTVDELDYKIEKAKRELEDKKVNHILHLLFSILTMGFWVIVWVLIALSVSSERSALEAKIKMFSEAKSKKLHVQSSYTEPTKTTSISEEDKRELKSLLELKDAGVITNDEFEARKSTILSK